MAVIHISEAEAERNLRTLITKVKSGDVVYIDGEDGNVKITAAGEGPMRGHSEPSRNVSEIILELQRRGADAVLDGGFGEHLTAVIREHESEETFDPWAVS